MREPYVESNIYDLTGNLAPAPSDDGYPIVGAVFSPTGPIEKRKVLSQKDFLDNYLLSSTVLPTDHDSIKFLFKVLEVNPVYVVRACPVTVLEGISSKGRSLLFDKSYHLLPKYYQFKITEIKDTLEWYYLVIDNTMYYTGVEPTDVIEGNPNKVKISDEKSLDLLIKGILKQANTDKVNSQIMDNGLGYLESRLPVTAWSSNIGLHKEIKEEGKYSSVSSSIDDATVEELDYINISGTSYYFSGRNFRSATSLANPVMITSPNAATVIDGAYVGGEMVSDYFFMKVIATSGCKSYGTLKFSIKSADGDTGNDVVFKDTSDETEVMGTTDTTNIDSLITDTSNLTLLDNTMLDISNGAKFLKATVNGQRYVFYIGEDGEMVDQKDGTEIILKAVCLGTKNYSVYQFVSMFLDRVCSLFPEYYQSWNSNSIVFDGSRVAYILEKSENVLSTYDGISGVDSGTGFQVTKDGTKLTYQYYTSTDANNTDYITYPYLGITVGDEYYYTGTPITTLPDTVSEVIRMSSEAVTYGQFLDLLEYNLYVRQEIGKYNDAFICTIVEEDEDGNDKSVDVIPFDPEVMIVSDKFVHQSAVEQFAIVQKFPSKSAILRFSYKKSKEDDQILDLTLNYKNGTSVVDWTMSFVPGVVDGYGIDQWYDRVQSDYFKVVSLTEEGELGELAEEVEAGGTYDSPYFGGKVSVPSFNVQYMKTAMQSIPEYDDDQYYYMLTDSGVINTSYASVIQALCTTLKAWYPVSLPSNTKNPQDIISFVGSANLNSYFVRMLAAGDREDVAGFSTILPGSLKLIRAILSLYRNQSMEFAPNFDLNNGTVGVSNLVQKFTRTQRELLLDYKVETLKGGVGSPYYINDNVTAQPKQTYLSENQNVLMTIVAIHECEGVAKYFKAELNTKATRKRFQDALNAALEDRLFKGKAYAPYSYYAVCDETNNPLNVINDNKLVASLYAQYTPSAKKVILDHFIIPLQQA